MDKTKKFILLQIFNVAWQDREVKILLESKTKRGLKVSLPLCCRYSFRICFSTIWSTYYLGQTQHCNILQMQYKQSQKKGTSFVQVFFPGSSCFVMGTTLSGIAESEIWLSESWKPLLHLCSRRWLKSSLNLVNNLTPLGLWQLKTLLQKRHMNFRISSFFFEIFKLFEWWIFCGPVCSIP